MLGIPAIALPTNAITLYEAGVGIFGEFVPLTLGAEFELSIPPIEPFDWERSVSFPEDPLRADIGPFAFEFEGPDFLQTFTFQTDISLTGKLRAEGAANLIGRLMALQGSSTGQMSGQIGAGINLIASAQPDGFFCGIPFGVGDFLCEERSVELPVVGTPQFRANDTVVLPVPAPIDIDQSVGVSATLFAESSATVGASLFFRGANTINELDFGDAPDSYGTLLNSNGPRYVEGDLQRLGLLWDKEANGQPTVLADGDDLSLLGGNPSPLDDEDGVIFGSNFVDILFNITRPGENNYNLSAWWDCNRDGDFDHGGTTNGNCPNSQGLELVIDDDLLLTPGIFTKRYNLGFDPKDFYSRFRLTCNPIEDVTPVGEIFSNDNCNVSGPVRQSISYGEVEDYPPVPEPTSTISLLGLGTIGTVSILKHKLKPFKTEKNKVG